MIQPDHLAAVAPPDADDSPVHPLACFHRKWRVDADAATQAGAQAAAALTATFTDEQQALFLAYDAALGLETVAAVDRFIDGLAAHFPGIAPAIRAVAYHVEDNAGEACCGEAGARTQSSRGV